MTSIPILLKVRELVEQVIKEEVPKLTVQIEEILKREK